MLSSPDFLHRLSSAEPVPGGGSVAALDVAMASALLVMVSNLTLNRKRYEEVHAQVTVLRDSAVHLRQRAVDLAEADSAAYAAVAAAAALPRESEEQKVYRRERMQSALKAAVEPPLATMQAALEALELAELLASAGNTSAISDVGTAVLCARAAYYAAQLNVEINTVAVRDAAWRAEIAQRLTQLPAPDAVERRVLEQVHAVIRGYNA